MQILFIKYNRIEVNGISAVLKRDISLDIVPFVSYDELPSVLDKNVYCALLLVAPRLTEDTLRYIKAVRKKKYQAPVYLIAAVSSPDIYNSAMAVPDLYIFEPSSTLDQQLTFILKMIEKQCIYQLSSTDLPFQLMVENVPDNAAIIDNSGTILVVNDAFRATFGLIGQTFPAPLGDFIPDFAYEELIRKLVYRQAPSSSIITNFAAPKGGIVPVEILISEPLLGKEAYVIVFRDRSEIIAIKRMAEFQGRMHEELKLLVRNALQTTQNPMMERAFIEQIKVLFNCNQVFTINLEWKKSLDKTFIDTRHITPASESFLSVFANLIEMAIKQNIPTVYHFSEENPTHDVYLTWAKTLIAIPVRTTQTNYATVFLAYANSYEPDSSMFGVFELLADLLAYRFNQLEYVQIQIETEKDREVVTPSLDGIFKTQVDGTFLYVNQAFVDLLGYDGVPDFYSGINAVDLFSNKNDRMEFINLLENKKVLRNNITRLVRQDGKEIIVLEHARLIIDPEMGQPVIEGTLREISSDMDVIKVLAESRSFSDDLIEKAGVMIAAVDDEQEFLVWNKRAEEVLGYLSGDVLGSKVLITQMFPDKKYRDFAMQKLNEAIFDESGLQAELVCRSSEGHDRIISWSIRRMTSTTFGKINLLFGTDVTDIRRLEKRVVENQKMEAISGIVEIFAAQFQEMVHAISENVHEIQENPDGMNSRIFYRITEKLRDSNHLIDRIISLSSLSHHKLSDASDADQLIENSFQILRGIIPDRINLHYDLNGFSMVQMEESQFNQMIMNLALNSVEAIENTGEIHIESQKVRLADDPFLQENKATRNLYLRLSFSDTGKGMDSIVKNKIFDPFFTTSTDKSRIGLGLTLIYNMVNAAHGYIKVDSSPGEGTTVIIYLPVHEARLSTSGRPSRVREMCVLVIDDQLLIRELLKDILSSEGYKVLLAEDGLAGVDMYKKHKEEIDLVILDIIMPKLYGDEVYARLKKVNPAIKVLIISGHVQPDIIQKLKKQGINGYLKKPFEIQTVQKQLNNILGS